MRTAEHQEDFYRSLLTHQEKKQVCRGCNRGFEDDEVPAFKKYVRDRSQPRFTCVKLTVARLQIERQIAKFRSGSQKQVQEMTVELKSWQQQESTYQKLIHEHAEMSKKASESIPETKEKIKRLQGKIETANKDINEVRCWLLWRRKIAASRVLTDFFD